ncbi:unnamed protein product [Ceutorhynchus assimilis]|uniref:GH18 domain-containing protein n=1 Tax=Ceutorhynchus assimilis TaxID=467358 RepID=A0A9N9MNC1_9CUCU|nr:unnamed protein product [Ceutorhynchus assimilis]
MELLHYCYVEGLAKLKLINPELKLLFSVSDRNSAMTKVVANETLRKTFKENAYNLVKTFNYDGIDLDWEFPKEKDKENFVILLSELKIEFTKHDYLVTAAVRAIPIYKDTGYNVPEMSKYLDIINVMTYDFYGSWSKTTGQNSPLYSSSLDSAYERKYLNINASINNWVDAGAPKNILAMGLPFYGRTFTLKNASDHGIHAPSSGGGRPLAPTYYQILSNYQNFTTEWNEEQKAPYKYSGTTWLGYEDERSIIMKVKYAVDNQLFGVFLWHLGCDDVHGEFSDKKQTLVQTINDA